MNFYKTPLPPQYDRSVKGIKEFAANWINTPHSLERIVPSWPFDILCGLAFLTTPFWASFFSM